MTKLIAVKIVFYFAVVGTAFTLHEQWMAVTQATLGGWVLGILTERLATAFSKPA